MPRPEVVDSAAETLRILADPTRLRLLWALSQGESSVSCLAELAGTTPTKVSQHLSKLRFTGLVRARRDGTFMFYSVVDPALGGLLKTILDTAHLPGTEPLRTAAVS